MKSLYTPFKKYIVFLRKFTAHFCSIYQGVTSTILLHTSDHYGRCTLYTLDKVELPIKFDESPPNISKKKINIAVAIKPPPPFL